MQHSWNHFFVCELLSGKHSPDSLKAKPLFFKDWAVMVFWEVYTFDILLKAYYI